MTEVRTPDGYGQVLGTQSVRGKTSYLVKGAGFEGWYDGLQVEADFADQPDDVIPNEDNDVVLPYPSRPQGPGWDSTNSTIQPNIDPHLDMSGASDSLTGEPTDEDPVKADIEGLFEPHSRLSGARTHRLHFATSEDPILDVSALPDESPTGLDNSPINPDNVDTDDLFDGDSPHFERESAVYERLVIKDDLAFLRYAAADPDDDKKKHHREHGSGQVGYSRNSDDDSDGDDDSRGGDSDDDPSSDDGGDGDDSGGSGGDGGSGSGHTAAAVFALTTTADLHFLANMCHCAESLPLHSKSEHRELQAESASDVDGVAPQKQDLEHLLERYQQDNFNYQESNLRNLVDRSEDAGDGGELLNHYASTREVDGWLVNEHGQAIPKTAAPAQQDPGPTQIESQIEQLMQFWAVDNNGWWHWTGSQADLALLNQMQQQMMAVGMPGGPPGQMQAQSAVRAIEYGVMSLPEMTVTSHPDRASAGISIAQGPKPGPDKQAPVLVYRKDPDSEWRSVWTHRSPTKLSFRIEADTPVLWREYLQTVASDRLVALAAWADVVQKSKRLRAEGAIDLEVFKPEVITAYVQGDNGRYYTTVQRLGSVASGVGRQLTSTQVSGWSCECDWGHWAWIRKRSFVGRMCSHAYALFSEMRSLDAKRRRGDGNGKPLKLSSVGNKASWARMVDGGFEWVSSDPTLPTAAIAKTASGWDAQVWSDGTAEDSLDLGSFKHSEQARRVIARIVAAHIKLAEAGDVDMVGGGGDGAFEPYQAPDSISGGYDKDPYSEDGAPEPILSQEDQQGNPGVQEGTTRTGSFSVFAEHDDGQDDEGSEQSDDGIEEEDPDDESLDEEIAEDEDNLNDGQSDEGDESNSESQNNDDDGGHDEPHQRDDEDDNGDTDNPGDDSDDEGIEKHSSVAELQNKFGLSHLAGANYSLADQNKLTQEGNGKTARNRGDLNLKGTHYEAGGDSTESPEDTLAFLF